MDFEWTKLRENDDVLYRKTLGVVHPSDGYRNKKKHPRVDTLPVSEGRR